ncbi:MAG: polysulfide reductase NrfD [Thermoanaerobacteraceae bacterium]|nr:polysulfide reductase NrfD [Thermoanaerobacteraceae bacterium]
MRKTLPWAVTVAALVVGSYGLYSRLFYGHAENFGNYVTWGIWVSTYLYFIGLSAGAFLVGTAFKELRKLSRVVALAACTGGLLAIWLDLGHMERFYRTLIVPNFSSPISWLVWFYTLYFILLGWSNYRNLWKGAEESQGLGWAGIVLVLGIILSSSFLFALNTAKPFWNTAVLPLLFLGAAVTSGSALLTLLSSILRPDDKELLARLKQVVLGSLALTAFLEFSEIFLAVKGGAPEHYEVARSLLVGAYAPVFWIGVVLVAFIVPLILLQPPRSGGKKTQWGCISLLVGFFALRYLFVISAQGVPSLKGLETAVREARYSFEYVPSAGEWFTVVFLCGLVAALVLTGLARIEEFKVAGEREKEAKINA